MGETVTDHSAGCVPYTDCPVDAFNVSMPATAFPGLQLPFLDWLAITDLNGLGEQAQT